MIAPVKKKPRLCLPFQGTETGTGMMIFSVILVISDLQQSFIESD